MQNRHQSLKTNSRVKNLNLNIFKASLLKVLKLIKDKK
jgi:hypothetical protein